MGINYIKILTLPPKLIYLPFRIQTPKHYVDEQLRCVDRAGQAVAVSKKQTGLFRFFYDCAAGKLLLHGVTLPEVSKLAGLILNSRPSALLVAPFVRRNEIDMSDYEPGPFKSFNAFFTRKILPNARNIDSAPDAVISPCDGKVQVFPINENSHFEIKGISYTIHKLLRDEELAERYQGGTLMLLRLGVADYHRYVFPVNGSIYKYMRIDGKLHTVNPYVASRRPIYTENSREYALIETENMGKVLMMEVGALMVGRIMNSHATGMVFRGDEKGYFKFGASSIVLCFEKDAVIPDADLVEHSENGEETLIRLGERIALATKI